MMNETNEVNSDFNSQNQNDLIDDELLATSIAKVAPVIEKKPSLDYLQELLKDKRQLSGFPNYFHHMDRLLESEIGKVRIELFHLNRTTFTGETVDLPEPEGSKETITEKIFIPVKENPTYNFVGRLLGPGGMTAKHMEKMLKCKIMIRGRGSMRDKKKEEQNRGKPNWEHLNEELHVLVSVEDTPNRAAVRLSQAVEQITAFLEEAVKTPVGEDDIKKKQLMELALLNGTYRDMTRSQTQLHVVTSEPVVNSLSLKANKANFPNFQPWLTQAAALSPFFRPGATNLYQMNAPVAGATSGHFQQHQNRLTASHTANNPATLYPTDAAGQVFPFPADYMLTANNPAAISNGRLIEYTNQLNHNPSWGLDSSGAGILHQSLTGPLKTTIADMRVHPYSRKTPS